MYRRDVDLDTPEPLPIVDRECLRCGDAFKAKGRFNRLCLRCHDIIRGLTSADHTIRYQARSR